MNHKDKALRIACLAFRTLANQPRPLMRHINGCKICCPPSGFYCAVGRAVAIAEKELSPIYTGDEFKMLSDLCGIALPMKHRFDRKEIDLNTINKIHSEVMENAAKKNNSVS